VSCRSRRRASFNKVARADVWFALDDSRPLAAFAGIWTNWTWVRKLKWARDGEGSFGFLTTEPDDVLARIQSRQLPAILTTHEQTEMWMTAPAGQALKLQLPLISRSSSFLSLAEPRVVKHPGHSRPR
jgi:putative SOS response-associated peptidase YedK